MSLQGRRHRITDLLSGQIDSRVRALLVLLGHIHEGRVRRLAVTGATRSAELPDIPP